MQRDLPLKVRWD